jgi:hypothetical protein
MIMIFTVKHIEDGRHLNLVLWFEKSQETCEGAMWLHKLH